MTPTTCYRHPGVAATDTCSVCRKGVCDPCLTWADMKPACVLCARKRRRGSANRQIVIIGVSIFLGCSGITAATLLYRKPFDYGSESGNVILARQALERNPCDAGEIVTLTEAMLRAGDYGGSLERAHDWLERCGENQRLRWVTYGAYRDLGKNSEAIREATRLVELDPDDKDYWWWRAVIYERMGQHGKAASDYEKSLEIMPSLTRIPFNLADVYERLDRPCDALRPLARYVEHHPDKADDGTVANRLSRLRTECDAELAAHQPDPNARDRFGRVALQGATIELPEGFVALPKESWGMQRELVATESGEMRAFSHTTERGDTIVTLRSSDVPREKIDWSRMAIAVERLASAGSGKIVRSQTKPGPRWQTVAVSFDRGPNSGELRALGGVLEGEETVRLWTVECTDRPRTKSSRCEEITRSLTVIDAGTLRPLVE